MRSANKLRPRLLLQTAKETAASRYAATEPATRRWNRNIWRRRSRAEKPAMRSYKHAFPWMVLICLLPAKEWRVGGGDLMICLYRICWRRSTTDSMICLHQANMGFDFVQFHLSGSRVLWYRGGAEQLTTDKPPKIGKGASSGKPSRIAAHHRQLTADEPSRIGKEAF